jgi:ABC-2 type transport system permease protein
MYLVVPDNFAQNLIDIQNIPMQAYISTEDKTRAIVLKNMLEAYEKYISAVEINCVSLYEVMKEAGMPDELRQQVNIEISMDLVFTALGKADFFELVDLEGIKAVPIATYYGFEILFLFISYLALLAGMDLLRERRQGLLMRLISTGTKIRLVTTQKLLLYTTLIGSLLGFLYLMLSIRGISIYHGVFIFILLYFALASVFFMLLSAFFTKLPTFLLVSNVFILFGAVIGGGMIPLEFLPNSMIAIAKTSVNYWFLRTSTLLFSGNQKLSIMLCMTIILCIVLGIILSSLLISRKEGMHREDI